MSATKPQRGGGVVAGAPAWPQVNLLPPEIRASRSLRAVKRILALVLVGVIALAAVVHVAVQLQLDATRDELADAQAETQRLIAAQREFAEVPQVLSQLDDATTARTLGMSTEILWRDPLTMLVATLPPGVRISSVVVTGATPVQQPAWTTNPLREQSVATVEFTGIAPLLPDTAAWIEALESIPTWRDAFVTTAAITEGTEGSLTGQVYYEVTGTVQISQDAWALRFDTAEEG